jgi:hypothetical protein
MDDGRLDEAALADGSFTVNNELTNKDETEAHSATLDMSGTPNCDFYAGSAAVCDVGASKDLGDFHGIFNATVRSNIAHLILPHCPSYTNKIE